MKKPNTKQIIAERKSRTAQIHENYISALKNREANAKTQATLSKVGGALGYCCGIGGTIAAIAEFANKNYEDCAGLIGYAILLFLIGHMAYSTYDELTKQAQKIHKQILKQQKLKTK